MSRFRLRPPSPSPALLVAVLALVVALGGTSYAAVSLARNSVLSQHIKNGQVKAPDLGTGSVRSRTVKDGSLRARDFKPGQLPAGPAGPRGPQGIPGPVDTVTVVASSSPIAPGDFGSAQADCPSGTEAIGGGIDPGNVFTMVVTGTYPLIDNQPRLALVANGQHGSATGWVGWARNNSTTSYTLTVAVVCGR